MKLLKPLVNVQKIGFNSSVALPTICSKRTRYFTRNNGSNIRGRGISNSLNDMDFLKPEPKPKLVVFDLDWTMWPFHVECDVCPPFKKRSGDEIYDKYGDHVTYFPDVPEILEKLTQEGYVVAAASRTIEPKRAAQLLKLWDWDRYFTYKEIYPGCKVTHFGNFQKNSGFRYDEMLFFDDEYRNIVDITKLGVTCYYCEQGISKAELEAGFKKFRDEQKKDKLGLGFKSS